MTRKEPLNAQSLSLIAVNREPARQVHYLAIMLNARWTTVAGVDGPFGRIDLPLLEIGQDQPVVLVTAMVHGDEELGPLVLDRLLQTLNHQTWQRGTLAFVAVANPLAYQRRHRISDDRLDLNRVFPGASLEPTRRIAQNLRQWAANVHPVAAIDLHVWRRLQTPLLGVGFPADAGSQQLMDHFGLDAYWQWDGGHADQAKYAGTWLHTLRELEIPSVIIETSSHWGDIGDAVKRCSDGIVRVMAQHGLIDTAPTMVGSGILARGAMLRAEVGGVWRPSPLKPLSRVTEGQLLGVVHNLAQLRVYPLIAPHEGIVLQIAWPQLVLEGEELVNLGQPIRS